MTRGPAGGPRTLVIVLNWRRPAATVRCLGAVLSSAGPGKDVLVVDNGSGDSSRAVIARGHPGVEVLALPVNLGYAGGNNRGLELALERGYDFAWILNNDTVPAPDALALALDVAVEQHAGVVVSTQWDHVVPGDGGQIQPHPICAVETGRRDRPVSCVGCPAGCHAVDVASGAALLVRLDAIRAVGLMDETFFHYGEEVDFCHRLAESGWPSVLACRSHVWHERGGTLDTSSPAALYYRTRNTLRALRRRHGLSTAGVLVTRPRFTLEAATQALRPGPGRGVRLRAVVSGLADGHRDRGGPQRVAGQELRVLVIGHAAGLAGGERAMHELLTRLPGDVRALTVLPGRGPLVRELREAGLAVRVRRSSWWLARRNGAVVTPLRLAVGAARLPALLVTAARFRPHVVYTNSLVVPWGAVVAKVLARPHVWHVREILPGNSSLRSSIPPAMLLRLVRAGSTRVIAVSETVAAQFEDLPGTAPVTVVHDGVPVPVPAPAPARAPDDRCRIVVVGTLHPVKGQHTAIEALALLRHEHPDLRLQLVGRGDPHDEADLRRLVDERAVTDRVEFLGMLADPAVVVRGSVLALVPSLTEAYGRVTLEAMHLGVPVIGTDAGGTAEILRHGGGLLVPPDDPHALAAAMSKLLDDPGLRRDLAARAVEVARSFDLDASCAAVVRELRAAAEVAV